MASLYIKDGDVAARVDRIARQLGTTKTETVSRALSALEEQIQSDSPAKRGVAERMAAYRAQHPLPPKVAEADRAFFDRLWGEPED